MITNEYTENGLRVYGRLAGIDGSEVRVQESSYADQEAVWIFTTHPQYVDCDPHLNKHHVLELMGILQEVYEKMERVEG